jgi:IclR family acetate operon transcriptional repressor
LEREYLRFADTDRSRYRLGPRVAELAEVMRRPNSAVEKVRPVLKHLSDALNETSGYYEKRGDEVVCLATEPGRQPLRYAMEVGQRVRLYANSCGKALLAAMPAAELKDYFNTLKPIPYTPRTMSSVEAIRRNLVSIRKSGISRSNEEYLPGIVALAVAVWDKDGPIGAINVAVPTVRFNRDLERAIQRELKSAAKMFEAT